mmetsp:Transcript_8250/g.24877  ORF Transcript_8250/g.24877 Transcript_8250/m.24877 type:complete len:364 (-) Transcript_8250:1514-2605(-)
MTEAIIAASISGFPRATAQLLQLTVVAASSISPSPKPRSTESGESTRDFRALSVHYCLAGMASSSAWLCSQWRFATPTQRLPASTRMPLSLPPSLPRATTSAASPPCSACRHNNGLEQRPVARAACAGENGSRDEEGSSPWAIKGYFTKQHRREIDAMGSIVQSPDNVSEPLGWTEEAKLTLALQVVARERDMPEAQVTQKFSTLCMLLPDLPRVKVANLIRASVNAADAAETLLVLREALPHANVSKLVAGHPELLQLGVPQLCDNLACVSDTLSRSGCPPEEWQALLEQAPYLADPCQLQATMGEIARLFGAAAAGEGQAARLLIMQPDLALSCEGLIKIPNNDPGDTYLTGEALPFRADS